MIRSLLPLSTTESVQARSPSQFVGAGKSSADVWPSPCGGRPVLRRATRGHRVYRVAVSGVDLMAVAKLVQRNIREVAINEFRSLQGLAPVNRLMLLLDPYRSLEVRLTKRFRLATTVGSSCWSRAS